MVSRFPLPQSKNLEKRGPKIWLYTSLVWRFTITRRLTTSLSTQTYDTMQICRSSCFLKHVQRGPKVTSLVTFGLLCMSGILSHWRSFSWFTELWTFGAATFRTHGTSDHYEPFLISDLWTFGLGSYQKDLLSFLLENLWRFSTHSGIKLNASYRPMVLEC
jgi:hypothetical protein